jgi:hypothetical protein
LEGAISGLMDVVGQMIDTQRPSAYIIANQYMSLSIVECNTCTIGCFGPPHEMAYSRGKITILLQLPLLF